ncbi:TetR/AcrR family transcriptional regulator [Gordonia sinesedis]
MSRSGDRRQLIADRAIAVLADGGPRALTHHAVDRRAGLATGSTSYYFRTRAALIGAAIDRIRDESRTAFANANPPVAPTPDSAAALIDEHLTTLVCARREQALAVFALLPEVADDTTLRIALTDCLFSRPAAAELATALGSRSPDTDALDLIAFLTGTLFDRLYGVRRDLSATGATDTHAARESIARLLRSFTE